MRPQLFTIPSTDEAFRKFVQRTVGHANPGAPAEFERRLRRTYPRVLVRERGLTGEVPSWYVYRDGTWRSGGSDAWWEDPNAPRVSVDAEGWIRSGNPTARGLLGADFDPEPRHFTDFVVPGGLDDAVALFEIVQATGGLEATVVLQPTSGDAIAVDIRVAPADGGMAAAMRLAGDIEVPQSSAPAPRPDRIDYAPATDVAFRAYAERALDRMPEPTPDGLALRLRRLYPHAQVEALPDGWVARRDHEVDGHVRDPWWTADGLPRVRYDAMALILDANDAATGFFGRSMVGHHWQEFVTAGSSDEVGVMLEILAAAGAAESRFRMPRGDGSLVEFDSYTVVEGNEFSTVFRPVPEAVPTS